MNIKIPRDKSHTEKIINVDKISELCILNARLCVMDEKIIIKIK